MQPKIMLFWWGEVKYIWPSYLKKINLTAFFCKDCIIDIWQGPKCATVLPPISFFWTVAKKAHCGFFLVSLKSTIEIVKSYLIFIQRQSVINKIKLKKNEEMSHTLDGINFFPDNSWWFKHIFVIYLACRYYIIFHIALFFLA